METFGLFSEHCLKYLNSKLQLRKAIYHLMDFYRAQ